MFLIMSLLGRPVYDPNPLKPNPNPQKHVSGSCRVRGLGQTLTPLGPGSSNAVAGFSRQHTGSVWHTAGRGTMSGWCIASGQRT